MTEAEQKLIDAAREHWITGKYNHLIADVNAERTDGDVLVRMPAEDWEALLRYVSVWRAVVGSLDV